MITIKNIWSLIQERLPSKSDAFLQEVSGVLHIGANIGQERKSYARLGLRVLWVEPIPEVFSELVNNIKHFQDQQAVQALITDREKQLYSFHIANNNGASSSIFNLKKHQDIWPEVVYTKTVQLESCTLVSLFNKEYIDPENYQALVMDTQGSELLILKGAKPLLKHFKYIKIEVPDFESYEDCCQLPDVEDFMTQQGFSEWSRNRIARRKQGGNYFDIVYRQKLLS